MRGRKWGTDCSGVVCYGDWEEGVVGVGVGGLLDGSGILGGVKK